MRWLCFAAALAALGCGAGPDQGNAPYQVRESVGQLAVTHAMPGERLSLTDASGAEVQSATADMLGSYLFRKVAPGTGYVVRAPDESPAGYSRALRVESVAESQPAQDFYSGQILQPGFGYITTRDGTELSIYVTMPGPPEMGPYPTVVNYSGYDPSRPGMPVPGNYSYLCDKIPSLCDAPNDPSGLIASLFNYATVSVNMRGTGCSGGAYDYFETLQLLDGYDVIETVSAQPWVLHGKVGMTGLSYPGITQLFVASTKPPHLAAITPLSVIGNSATTLVPGGILNDGFAIDWVTHVLNQADPYGQGWEQARVDGGDAVCKENQLLHGQKIDNVAQAKDPAYYTHEVIDPLNPTLFVDQIDVPVFLAGSWQDEQTGPFFTTLLDKFTSAPVVRLTVHNGVHPDGFAPEVLAEWKIFLDLYVAQKVPVTDGLIVDLSPVLFNQIFKVAMRLPPDRLAAAATYEEARATYEKEPPLKVIFESGGSVPDGLGAPQGTFDVSFAAWPPPPQQLERLYLGAGGALSEQPPPDVFAASSFDLDPGAGERGILAPNGDVWDPLPAYDWKQPQPDLAAVFESAPLAADQVMAGTGSADLWVKSTADDADLQVTITEVRPDGKEMYVQSGWLRASSRKLDPAASTPLWPSLSYVGTDIVPLVPGDWTPVRVPLAGFGHVFRAGSRIRLIIDTPGGTRAAWRFALKTFPGPVTHAIAHDATLSSSIALPLLSGVAAPSPLPTCPSLRGQPCRDHQPYPNRPSP